MKKVLRTIAKGSASACLALMLCAGSACTVPEEKECEHVWTPGTETSATCTKNGEKNFTCSVCGETKTEFVPALGHDLPKTGTMTKAPTCAEAGVTSYGCTVCGETVTEPIPMTGHTYDDGAVTTDPGCFSNGVKTYTCTVCGNTYTESVEPAGHIDVDADGNCDRCNEFVGEIGYDVADTIPYVAGPWENPAGFSWWSYGLEKAPSEEPLIISPSSEQTHTEGKKSIKIDFTNGSKCTPDNPGGAYVIHLGMDHLMRKQNYTLTFYAWASDDFTGTLNKMLDNDNFGPGTTIEAISYNKVYSAEEIAGKGWVKVEVTMVANPTLEHSDRACFRIAFDVGTEGYKGQLYLADFNIVYTDYLRVQQGLPPLNEPTKPVNTTPVLDKVPDNAILLPDSIAENGVWLPGPLCFGAGIVSIDPTVEYAKGGKSILMNANKALSAGESGFILPISDLVEGKRYELTFYAQGSTNYNGAINRIFQNPSYTFMHGDGTETPTMLDVIVNAGPLYTLGAMQGQDWTKVSMIFTAHPKEGLCSFRVQMQHTEEYRGQIWFSGFEIGDAPEEIADTPQVTAPVLNEVPENAVLLPEKFEESYPWLAGPGYFGDAIFAIDENVEYAKGGKSLSIDFNKASVGKEMAFYFSFPDLIEGNQYEFSFYLQGSTNYNGALKKILANENYDVGGVWTMYDITVEEDGIFAPGALQTGGWHKVTVKFTAKPKDGLCSIRIEVQREEGWVGTLWMSGLVLEGAKAVVDEDVPTVKDPVLNKVPDNALLLPDALPADGVWTPGPLHFGADIVSIDPTVEYAKGGKSIVIDTNKATAAGESGFILPISNLVEGKRYELTFYAQGSTNYNGAINRIFQNPSYTFMHDDGTETPTMLDVIVREGPLYTMGAMQGQGWTKITVTFTAHPREGLCSFRVQMQHTAAYHGKIWFSGFEIGNAPEDVADTPQVTTPVLDKVSENAVLLPEKFEESAPWLAGPGYFGDAIFAIDESVEYAKGGKSLSINFNKASVGKETAFYFSFPNLVEGKKYEFSFYLQGSTNYNGALKKILANENYDVGGVWTMYDIEVDADGIFTPGALQTGGWRKVTVKFTAKPKDGLCSIRIEVQREEGWVGTLWVSGLELVSAEDVKPEADAPQVTAPVLDKVSENHVALPEAMPENAPWLAGPGYWGDAVVSIDSTVEYAKGGKSLKVDFNQATVGTETAIFLKFDNLTAGKRYTMTFYVQGSNNYNGALDRIFPNPNYTHMTDSGEVPTMTDVEYDVGKIYEVNGLNGAGWQKVTITFTANPRDGICSLRMQFRKQDGWTGTLWLSNFEIVPVEAAVSANVNAVLTVGTYSENSLSDGKEINL